MSKTAQADQSPCKTEISLGEVNYQVDDLVSDDGLPPEPPNGGYGWVMVAVVAAMNAASWGENTTFGVYDSFLIEHDYFSGGTTLRYAFVGGLSVGIAMLSAPLANLAVCHLGFRPPVAIGTIMVTLGQCLAGLCTTFGMYLVCQGVIFGFGLGMILVVSQPLLAQWFDRRLSLAQGLANGGAGLGGLVLANTTRLLVEKLSLKQALLINGGISAGVLLPALLLIRPGPANTGSKKQALQLSWLWHPGCIWVWLWGSFAMMGYFIMLYSLAPYATEGIGLSQTQGAALQSLLASGLMIGRPLTGFMLDLGGRLNIAVLAMMLGGISCWAFWLPARSFTLLAVFATSQGLLGGSLWSAAGPVLAQIVGVHNLTSALGMFWIIVAAPAALSNPAAVALVQYSRTELGRGLRESYQISIALCGGLFFLSGLCLYGAKAYRQKTYRVFQKT